MVVLTRNFAHLAALASLAAVCLVMPTNAAAISRESVSIHAHAGVSVSHSDGVRTRPTAASAAANHVSIYAGQSASYHHSLQLKHQPTAAANHVSIHASALISASHSYGARAPAPTPAMKVSIYGSLVIYIFLSQKSRDVA